MTTLGADGDFESRVKDLIDRGLSAYGDGDLERAMSFWKLALALDPDSDIAARYVAYVKRHFEIADETPAADPFAAAGAEHDVPFGLELVGPTEPFDFDAYAALESVPGPRSFDDGDEFAEHEPTRIAATAQPAQPSEGGFEIDEGWSLSTGEFEVDSMLRDREAGGTPIPRPTYEMSDLEVLGDVATGNLADALEPEPPPLELELELGADDADDGYDAIETRPLGPADALEDQLAAVTEGLMIAESGAIELELDPDPRAESGAAAWPQPELEVPLEPAPELAAAVANQSSKATVYGYQPTIKPSDAPEPEPPEPPEAPASATAQTVELEAEPLELFAPPPPDQNARDINDAYGLEVERELHVDNTPPTAEVAPPAPLSDTLSLELDRGPVSGAADLTLELGSAPDVESTPLELGRPGGAPRAPVVRDNLGLDLELGRAGNAPSTGDVEISFRSPTGHGGVGRAPGDLAGSHGFGDDIPVGREMTLDYNDDDDDDDDELEIDVEVGVPGGLHATGSGGLEDQLAELELEMSTGPESFEWRDHAVPGDDLATTEYRPVDPSSPAAIADRIRSEIARRAVPGEPPLAALRRRISGYIDRAGVEKQQNHMPAAAVAADLALSEEPESATAQKLIHQSQALLIEVFRDYLGSLDAVPAVGLPMHEIPTQELDHRTAFLLSRIDGTLSFEDILDVSGMPRLEALRYLCRLRLQGILEVR